MEKPAPKVHDLKIHEKRHRKVGLTLLKAAVQCVECDRGLAGFAIVTWDSRGLPQTTYWTGDSPIGEGMMPTYVSDALSRRIASDTAFEMVTGNRPNTIA